MRFTEIEGLRAWLAWAVVLSHSFVSLNFSPPLSSVLDGGTMVAVFVMISGFVITGLVIERQESWPRYITRRAFRIFPAYLVALAVGAFSQQLAIAGLSATTWGSTHSWFFDARSGAVDSVAQHPWAHWLLHLSLLQGVAPNNVLPWSSTAFVGPAWSLSLEWQFYLVAPMVVWLLRKRRWAPWLVLAAATAALLYNHDLFGRYDGYTSLIGGLWLFMIGMASRIAFPALKSLGLPAAAIAIAALALAHESATLLPIGLWLAFLAFLARPETQGSVLDTAFARVCKTLFGSWLPTTLGARSYSVYIIHMPILELLLYALPLRGLSQPQAYALLTPCLIVLTLIASELMYRLVERPMIRIGAQLAAPRPSPQPAGAA